MFPKDEFCLLTTVERLITEDGFSAARPKQAKEKRKVEPIISSIEHRALARLEISG
jgi:hypothetical protein